ncbi:PWWP domain-containing protein 2A-like [Daktulosphaira vitifoliae]|uniref:PWWP domain-containing protein 2A-like n=1 Tax=Daktulosphaira vitifoliae TaxID=58002 RepID=UPI0021AA0220|nr:PWWP domain-containing protein 2A-like [Daktulosphaira vitifoliae]
MDTNIGVFENAIIQVVVESVTSDMLVVSYTAKNGSVYQGILLNNAKKRFPCGSVPLTKAELSPRNYKTASDNDVLYAVSQRFTYFQNAPTTLKKIPNKTKKVKKPMTVRLRPRQILCTMCKSVCNENPNNVEISKFPIKNETKNFLPETNNEKRLLRSQGPVPELPNATSSCVSEVKSMCRNLIPNIVKLKSKELTRDINNYSNYIESNEWINKKDCKDDCDSSEIVLKKNHNDSINDLWHETAFDETKKTPIIKISFGSLGEGTVMEIPSRQTDGENEQDKSTRKRGKRRRPDGEKKKKHKKKHKDHNIKTNHFLLNSNHINNEKEFDFSEGANGKCEPISEIYSEINNSNVNSNGSPNHLIIPKAESPETCYFMLKTGKILYKNDIVWGKVKGFPWWPAKVSNFSTSNGEEQGSFINVTWFGSSTTSYLNCDQINPFLDFYKTRFNKHKKTASYKEAIKQAMAEAKQNVKNKNDS